MNLEEVNPAALTAVLRHFDWAPERKAPGLYEIWASDESEEDQVLLPLDPERGDYIALLQRAQRAILAHYGRAARDLIEMMEMRSRAALDATHWKRQTPFEAGVIGWEDGEALYTAARAQLAASAKATKESRRYHGNASAYLAKQFLDSTLMGQTDIGSFIITAFTPVSQRFHTSKHSEEVAWSRPRESETVTGREILDKFENAIRAVRSALDEYKSKPTPEIFLETVPNGVSYEFAKALSQLASYGESTIQIERQEDALGEAFEEDPPHRPSVVEITFEPVEASVLSSAANVLALDPEPQDVTLVGEVTLLSRSSTGEDRLIRLNIEDGADIRKARIRLSAEQYSLAVDAHRQEASFKVSGTLEKEGRIYWLYNPTDIEVLPVGTESSSSNAGENLTLF